MIVMLIGYEDMPKVERPYDVEVPSLVDEERQSFWTVFGRDLIGSGRKFGGSLKQRARTVV